MSTYGLVIVADVPDVEAGERLGEHIARFLADRPGYGEGVVYEVEETDEGARLSMNGQGVVADHKEASFFTDAPVGRAVICEDGDEYGVVFQVWKLDPAGSECVYRAYVQDPELDPEPSTAARSITGTEAAAAAAALYGADPQRLLALEADPSPVVDQLGIIGSPFDPWLKIFDREWPEI
ncbi:hypothetical protein MYK68_00875 [Gordonia sp. PP30]|uniref:hypothetical protein n=1 Tax=Gordonia sp. PP30 TaxID=2935861 RepID=UPI001FFFA12C|nr:hypothetical protein [Gordonia sp. PP30]UQE75230.1 hypothetical protein MYK68_00875 [Gordonia sp. PP30]